MYIGREEKNHIIEELKIHLDAKYDGSRKNLIVETCPHCGKGGSKFGIYVGPEDAKHTLFASHCFKCGRSTRTLEQLLDLVGRPDLMVEETTRVGVIEVPEWLSGVGEIDDNLDIVEMPEGWGRCYRNPYLNSRGFIFDDYEYFPVGTTRHTNFKYDDYVIFPIFDEGDIVGYVGRHVWPKAEIDKYNDRAKWAGKYQILRYKNSNINDFVKLLYNYDAVKEDVTDTVVVCEGIFDVIALTRKLDLYDNERIVPVCTFGKKISDTQIYKLQKKGVRTVVVAYDSDARDAALKAAEDMNEYFDCYIANMIGGKDFDEMDYEDIYDIFSNRLMTPVEFKLKTV